MRTSVLFFVSLWLAACGSVPPATVSGTGWAKAGVIYEIVATGVAFRPAG